MEAYERDDRPGCLPEELWVESILSWLSPEELASVGSTCSFFYRLSRDDHLWRPLCATCLLSRDADRVPDLARGTVCRWFWERAVACISMRQLARRWPLLGMTVNVVQSRARCSESAIHTLCGSLFWYYPLEANRGQPCIRSIRKTTVVGALQEKPADLTLVFFDRPPCPNELLLAIVAYSRDTTWTRFDVEELLRMVDKGDGCIGLWRFSVNPFFVRCPLEPWH